MGWGSRRTLLVVSGIIVAFWMNTKVMAQSPTIYGGLRASVDGLGANPDPEWLADVAKNMALRFKATPCVIWIATKFDNAVSEKMLTYFDKNGVKAFIQVEPHESSGDVLGLIDQNLGRFKSHPCVIGFGVDVEWYFFEDNGGLGRKVTDAVAKSWSERVRSHNANYILFLKHFFPEWMPPTYRDAIMFLSDSQEYPSIDKFLNETDPKSSWGVGYKIWAKKVEPAMTGMQFGYDPDRVWWNKYTHPYYDPQKVIGDSLLKAAPNTRFVFWVDFTVGDVRWDWKDSVTSINHKNGEKNSPMRILLQNNTITLTNPAGFSGSDIGVSLFDMRGKVVLMNRYPQNTTILVNLDNALSSGSYMLKMQSGSKTILTNKVTIHKN